MLVIVSLPLVYVYSYSIILSVFDFALQKMYLTSYMLSEFLNSQKDDMFLKIANSDI